MLISMFVAPLVRGSLAVPLLRTEFARRGKVAIALECSTYRQHNNRPYDSLQKTFADRKIAKYTTYRSWLISCEKIGRLLAPLPAYRTNA